VADSTPSALELLDTQDPKQQEVYNYIVESFNGDVLRRDLLSWIVLNNVSFHTIENEQCKRLLKRVHPFIEDDVVPYSTTVSR
jgi:hypothetical protein